MYAEAIGVCVMYIYLHKAWVSHHCSREREREMIIRVPYSTVVAGRVGSTCLCKGKAHVVVCFSILGLWGNTIMHAKVPS